MASFSSRSVMVLTGSGIHPEVSYPPQFTVLRLDNVDPVKVEFAHRRHSGLVRKRWAVGIVSEAGRVVNAFLFFVPPRSYNNRRRAAFEDTLRRACRQYIRNPQSRSGPLYGLVYYLHMNPTGLDADNISKPIWDALRGLLIVDDRDIKLRVAGTIDLGNYGTGDFDLSRVGPRVFKDFSRKLGTAEHVVYVELGDLEQKHFTFGWE